MINLTKALVWSIAATAVGVGCAVAAEPMGVARAEPCPADFRVPRPQPGNFGWMYNTIWTITDFTPHPSLETGDPAEEDYEHICPGDQLAFRETPLWTPDTEVRRFVIPGPTLAPRWNLQQGEEIELALTPGGRLCFLRELPHANPSSPKNHLFFFRWIITGNGVKKLQGVVRPQGGNQDTCAKPLSDSAHGGTFHGNEN